jgi:hypothetical protein
MYFLLCLDLSQVISSDENFVRVGCENGSLMNACWSNWPFLRAGKNYPNISRFFSGYSCWAVPSLFIYAVLLRNCKNVSFQLYKMNLVDSGKPEFSKVVTNQFINEKIQQKIQDKSFSGNFRSFLKFIPVALRMALIRSFKRLQSILCSYLRCLFRVQSQLVFSSNTNYGNNLCAILQPLI